MARRSSRLRGRSSCTPQPQRVSSLSHDRIFTTPKTAPRLTSLNESDDMPGAFPRSVSPTDDTPTRLNNHISNAVTGGHYTPKTPKDHTPLKPSPQEMHPSHYQPNTAKRLDEARWLGFSSMPAHTETAACASKALPGPGTPSKLRNQQSGMGSPDFQFTFNREQSLELSYEARKMMEEKRAEAVKIREQIAASAEDDDAPNDTLSRRLATPRSKVGRFSDVHMAHFKKMDSIVSHAAAARTDQAMPTPTSTMSTTSTSPLKRTLSKTGMTPARSLKRTQSKTDQNATSSALPRAKSTQSLQRRPDDEHSSPAKRIKRVIDDDAGPSRPSATDLLSTPTKFLRMHSTDPHLGPIAHTPTQSSLARTASVKSTKSSMIPSLSRSPSKSVLKVTEVTKSITPLLARSPSKMTIPKLVTDDSTTSTSPLLARPPTRPLVHEKPTEVQEDEQVGSRIPFFARSPSKPHHTVDQSGSAAEPKTALLARSPAKAAPADNPFAAEAALTKAGSTKLMTRFNLLRASPIKSILRSPQRLYSDDPAKVATGTHLATPPKHVAIIHKQPPKTAPVYKHVDFTASTKGVVDTDSAPDTPSKGSASLSKDEIKTIAQATFSYPELPTQEVVTAPALRKFNRRMTLGAGVAGDFTFRIGSGITFGPSPSRDHTAASKLSIRHVSAEPDFAAPEPTLAPAPGPGPAQQGKKRKLSDSRALAERTSSDKENSPAPPSEEEAESRPTKRSKPSAPDLRAVKPAQQQKPSSATGRLPTLGVKPKGAPTQMPAKDKRPGMLSQARLNLLAMPKRRRE